MRAGSAIERVALAAGTTLSVWGPDIFGRRDFLRRRKKLISGIHSKSVGKKIVSNRTIVYSVIDHFSFLVSVIEHRFPLR